MVTNYKNRHWIFLVFFWSLLGMTIWAQMIEDYDFLTAAIQAVLVLFCSAVLAHILSDVILPKALKQNKMSWFALQSVIVVLLLAFCLSLIYIVFSDSVLRRKAYPEAEDVDSLHFLWTRFYGNIPSAILICGTACGLRFYQEHNAIEKNHAQLQQVHLEAPEKD